MDIVFMGTPDFAAGVLKSIYESKNHNIVCVVTQPDRPKGRSGKMIASPVKEYAQSVDIPVFQPEKIKTSEAVAELSTYKADIFVVAAFGQILSKEILDMPRFGCVNVHASLLPEYRGAAPIQWSIADGLSQTGVTIMQMNEGLDTGDILTQVVIPIDNTDTGESLFDKLMDSGAKLLVDTLPLIEEGKVTPIPQDESKATYAKILKKEMGLIDFSMSANAIDCRIRAFTPWPGGYTYIDGKMLKIKKASVAGNDSEYIGEHKTPGTVAEVTKNSIVVKCGEGFIEITEVQLEGKKSMSVHDFLLGYKVTTGTLLGM